MRYVLVIVSLFAGVMVYLPTEADAVVCARGIHRAGCVGPRGAVGVRRGIYGPRAVGVVRRSYYGPRMVGVRRYRRW